jgi:hypothetical protein
MSPVEVELVAVPALKPPRRSNPAASKPDQVITACDRQVNDRQPGLPARQRIVTWQTAVLDRTDAVMLGAGHSAAPLWTVLGMAGLAGKSRMECRSSAVT